MKMGLHGSLPASATVAVRDSRSPQPPSGLTLPRLLLCVLVALTISAPIAIQKKMSIYTSSSFFWSGGAGCFAILASTVGLES